MPFLALPITIAALSIAPLAIILLALAHMAPVACALAAANAAASLIERVDIQGAIGTIASPAINALSPAVSHLMTTDFALMLMSVDVRVWLTLLAVLPLIVIIVTLVVLLFKNED